MEKTEFMSKETVSQEVTKILNNLFGNVKNDIVFLEENTIKNSSAGKKRSKYELKTSSNWSATSTGKSSILVMCIGMTMTEFIQEYKMNNIFIFNDPILSSISIYKNEPIWKTLGYVTCINTLNNKIGLHIYDLMPVDEVSIEIDKKIPKWLYSNPEKYAAFKCRLFLWWRIRCTFSSLNNDELSKFLKTFKFDHYLTKDD